MLFCLYKATQDLTTIVGQLAPANPALVFCLLPAQCAPGDLMNLASCTGKSIYKETQKGESIKYGLSKSGLTSFIKQIKESAACLGCSSGQRRG